ncbi:rhodanese-like domain-containing protein [Brachyspira sp. SAP_772]|uniref:rhodanese-like domain-containing protein n=1 Tax=Brachyspira sp. SAP_772 TaxID=2608385 RepID=UPI0012F509F8|nr:rhodanese-like domain-containing protein [Brachyspira sp. SAP_772]
MSNTLSLIILLIAVFIIITFVKKIIFAIMSKGKYKNIKLSEAIELYKNNKNIGLIDVRSYQEVQYSGYIKNSVNIALDDSNFNNKMSKLDKDKEYIVYCASGSRSSMACMRMYKLGFTKINNLTYAGYYALNNALKK